MTFGDSDGCLLSVFSHRASATGASPGSLAALTVLMQSGVCAFDVDCFETKDGILVIGHPDEVKSRLNLDHSPSDVNFAELRVRDRGQTSTVNDFIRAVALQSGPCGVSHSKSSSNSPKLRLLIEPKGSSASMGTILQLASAVRASGLKRAEVGVWVTSSKLADAVRLWGMTPLYPVKGADSARGTSDTSLHWQVIGPNVDNPQLFQLVETARSLHQAVVVWTVDTSAQLAKALEASVDGIISNEPLLIKKLLSEMCSVSISGEGSDSPAH